MEILNIVKSYYPRDVAKNPQNYMLDNYTVNKIKTFNSNIKCDAE